MNHQHSAWKVKWKERTPIPDSQSLLLPRVEHRRHDHEPRGDRSFAYAQHEPAREEPAEVRTRRVTGHGDSPDKYIDAALGVRERGNVR